MVQGFDTDQERKGMMSQSQQQPTGADSAPGRAGWLAMVLIGSFIALLSGALLAAGIAASTFLSSHTDGTYLLSPGAKISSQAYAVTAPPTALETSTEGRSGLPDLHFAVRAEANGDSPIFVGIGPSDEVAAYLSGVHTSEITGALGIPLTIQLRDVAGTEQPAPPETQQFWAAASSGAGSQALTWSIEPGEWTIVVMNANASAGIDAEVAVGLEVPWAGPTAAWLVVGASATILASALLIVFGAYGWGRRTSRDETLAASERRGFYPSTLTGELRAKPSRWLWLVKWILVIPHWIVLGLLWVAFLVTTIVAGFAILFSGRYPRPLFEFNVGVLRWSWRVSFYAYSALGTDHYPPFSLDRVEYPADFVVEYPERLSNGLVLVKSWLLAIPHLLIVAALTGSATYGLGATLWGSSLPTGVTFSLLGLLVVIAALILLFTGRYPQQLFDLILGINRWAYRVTTYVALMRDEYPPFRLDQGGREPEVEAASKGEQL